MTEPVWLRADVVLAIHNQQLAEHGGPSGVRDAGLLESALAAPVNRWRYERASIPTLAACYAFHLAGNHPFIDGNKRTAYICMRLFLQLIYDLDYINVSNVLVDPDFKIYKVDSSRAFRVDTELRKPASLTRFSRSVLDALRRLTLNDIETHLGDWLTPAQIKGLMGRRDQILELADQLISERGEEEVLYP